MAIGADVPRDVAYVGYALNGHTKLSRQLRVVLQGVEQLLVGRFKT